MDDAVRQKKEGAVWNKLAANYDTQTLQTFKQAYALSIRKACDVLSPQDRVLEIGCGTGIMTLGVAPHVKAVVATDIAPAMIAVAQNKAARRGVTNVEFYTYDGYALPYEPQTFEAVLLFNVLHFVKEPARILQEAHRLLKPSGYLISATDCYAEPVPITTRLKLGLQKLLNIVGVIAFVWYYHKQDLHVLFEEHGFSIIETEDLHKDPVNYYILAQKGESQ
jgi:ubiquinone/menaquinone biosynthesis C-methylase UbiE